MPSWNTAATINPTAAAFTPGNALRTTKVDKNKKYQVYKIEFMRVDSWGLVGAQLGLGIIFI